MNKRGKRGKEEKVITERTFVSFMNCCVQVVVIIRIKNVGTHLVQSTVP